MLDNSAPILYDWGRNTIGGNYHEKEHTYDLCCGNDSDVLRLCCFHASNEPVCHSVPDYAHRVPPQLPESQPTTAPTPPETEPVPTEPPSPLPPAPTETEPVPTEPDPSQQIREGRLTTKTIFPEARVDADGTGPVQTVKSFTEKYLYGTYYGITR